jgi:hypothetical protein
MDGGLHEVDDNAFVRVLLVNAFRGGNDSIRWNCVQFVVKLVDPELHKLMERVPGR